MKKRVSILLSIISVICISLYFVGCSTAVQVFIVGTYEANEIEDEPFSKAKLVIQAITEEEFENANGINVIKNSSTSKENKIYYSFELFIYSYEDGSYNKANISNMCHPQGWHANTYSGELEYNTSNFKINNMFIFSYNADDFQVNISYEGGEGAGQRNLFLYLVK